MPLNVNAIPLITAFEAREGYPAGSLLNVMLFETAGTLSPSVINRQSGAVGLLQFMPSTLRAMGYTTQQAAAMSVSDQLNKLVKPYLETYKRRVLSSGDWLDLYLSVLYPAAIGRPDNYVMFPPGTARYLQNKGLDIDKDGDVEKGDVRTAFSRAVNAIRRRVNLPAFSFGGILPLILLIVIFSMTLIKN